MVAKRKYNWPDTGQETPGTRRSYGSHKDYKLILNLRSKLLRAGGFRFNLCRAFEIISTAGI